MVAAAIAVLAIVAGCIPGLVGIHTALGLAAVAMAALRARSNKAARIAVGLGAVEGLVRNQNTVAIIIHACLSPAFLAACVAMGVRGSATRPLRSGFGLLVQWAPALVLLQIVLGAAYRHKALGVMPHMAGAILVAGLLLVVCTLILQRFPAPSQLRTAAGHLLGAVLLQVSLGIAVFVMRVLDMESNVAFLPAVVAHITVGSLTLAAATLVAMSYRRASAEETSVSGGVS